MTAILLVEDEPAIAEPLGYLLQREGYEVAIAADGGEAVARFGRGGIDLVLLDLMLPVLPGSYLSKGMLDARTDPTSSSVAETRDDPAVTDAMTFTGYTEFDSAQKNFFYTTINQNPGITINYKTDPEPWLYDRSSAMYELYMRSGFTTALREAVRSADFYADHLNSSGFFTLKPGDAKYAYNESLAYTYWLLGDNRMHAIAAARCS